MSIPDGEFSTVGTTPPLRWEQAGSKGLSLSNTTWFESGSVRAMKMCLDSVVPPRFF